jgi:hypothetical protein
MIAVKITPEANISADPLVAHLRTHREMPFSGAVDWLCQQYGVNVEGPRFVALAHDHNIVLDTGLSVAGCAAAHVILEDARFDLRPLTNDLEIIVAYGFMADRLVDLPLVRRTPTLRMTPYREPHWMPTLVTLADDAAA